MAGGLTTEGLVIETLAEILENFVARLRARFGNSLPVDDFTVEGQLVINVSEQLAKLWEQLEAVNSGQDPDKAAGASLDAVCMLTGTVRDPASSTTASLILTGDASTTIVEGSLVSTGLDFQLATDEEVALVAVPARATTTAYVVGDRVTKIGNVYQCVTAGTSGGVLVAFDTSDSITDGTVVWTFCGEGTAAADVDATCTETGPNQCPARSITTIESPIEGWLGVINLAAGGTGANQESDEDLRLKRAQELSRPGTGTLNAIRAALLDIVGVTSVTMFQNVDDEEDGDGMPPHSVEALVRGGDDQDIWDALLDNVAAGIKTHGNTDGTAEDSEGTEHAMSFSRPVEVPIYVTITLTYDADEYPTDGNDQVAAAIVEYGNAQRTGRDAVATALQSQAFAADIGVLKVTSCFIGIAPGPVSSADIVIAPRELATYDVARVVVNSSAGTP